MVTYKKGEILKQKCNKLLPSREGPFLVVERINDNSYKHVLPSENGVSTTFNVSNLSPFLANERNDTDMRANQGIHVRE